MLATTIVLAIFTAVLAGATIWYAYETRRYVKVSKKLLEVNKAHLLLTETKLISDFYMDESMAEGITNKDIQSKLLQDIRDMLSNFIKSRLGELEKVYGKTTTT